jgi:hypothetical protein
MYLIKYLAYSVGYKYAAIGTSSEVADAADAAGADWGGAVYAYRRPPQRPPPSAADESAAELSYARQLVILASSTLLPGFTRGILTRKLVSIMRFSHGVTAPPHLLEVCHRLVASGSLDGFIHSPMPTI